MIHLKHVRIVIILVSVFSGCIRQPAPPETSVSTVIPTVIPTTTTMVEPQQGGASISASIYMRASAENVTIYVPVFLDENKNE